MRHDEGTHQSGADAPGGRPGILGLVLLVEELHLESLAEVLSQEMAGAALQGLAVLHHRLDGIGIQGSGEALCFALHALNDGHGHIVLCKLSIDLEHQLSTLLSLFASGMSRVAFLPKEFAGAQEQTGTHLPTHHVAPLVDQQRQVAI